jgi:hypothetical protein
MLGDPPQRRVRDIGGERAKREEARFLDLEIVDARRALGECGEQGDRVPLAFGAVEMLRNPHQPANHQADLLLHLPRRSAFGSLAAADAAARQHEEMGGAVAVADEKELARGVEHHHLGAARTHPQDAVDEAPGAVEDLHDEPHRRRIAQAGVGAQQARRPRPPTSPIENALARRRAAPISGP